MVRSVAVLGDVSVPITVVVAPALQIAGNNMSGAYPTLGETPDHVVCLQITAMTLPRPSRSTTLVTQAQVSVRVGSSMYVAHDHLLMFHVKV